MTEALRTLSSLRHERLSEASAELAQHHAACEQARAVYRQRQDAQRLAEAQERALQGLFSGSTRLGELRRLESQLEGVRLEVQRALARAAEARAALRQAEHGLQEAEARTREARIQTLAVEQVIERDEREEKRLGEVRDENEADDHFRSRTLR